MSNNKVKILIAYHNEKDIVLRSNTLFPIQVGSILSDKLLEDMLHDHIGENISELNYSFCELTAIYWAWKNLDKLDNPEYIGLFHYRRHFAFWDNIEESSVVTPWYFDELNDDYINHARLQDDNIVRLISKYDLIVPIMLPQENGLSNRDQYANYHNIDDLDMTIEILLHKYPEYQDVVNEYLKLKKTHFFNMGVMRIDIFNQYAEWLFDILFDVNNNIDMKYYSKTESRVIGYLAERLTSIFFLKLQKDQQYKIKNLPVTMVNKTKINDSYHEVIPAFSSNNISIVLSANDLYAPYLCVTIQSILNNSNPNYNYDILVFNIDITEKNQQKILNHINVNNVSLRFIKVDINVDLLEQQIATSDIKHISPDSMSRLLIPKMLKNYSRILYIDVDLIVCSDLSDLFFDSEFDSVPIAGSPDIAMRAAINQRNQGIKDYLSKELGLPNIYNYLQAGVLLFNLGFISSEQTKMLQDAIYQNWKFFDQCILNKVFNDNKGFFDLSWNFTVLDGHGNLEKINLLSYMPSRDADLYKSLEKSVPNIIHYVGGQKPWFYPQNYFANLWWRVARDTDYYEEILVRLANYSSKNCMFEKSLVSSERHFLVINKIKNNKLFNWINLFLYNLKTSGIRITTRKVIRKIKQKTL